MKITDWLFLIVFVLIVGLLGSDDFDYKCKRAHEMSKNETCTMVAGK